MSLDDYFNIKKKEQIKLINGSNILFFKLKKKYEFKEIFNSIPWVQPLVTIYGNTFKPKRKVSTMGKPYDYNGNVTTKETPIPDLIKDIMLEVNKITENDYNTCIANYYKDGEAYISMHDDGEKSSESIASVSFGATRKFVVQNKYSKEKHEINLNDYDMIVMNGKYFQRDYKHGIPKQLREKNPRISLTFRKY